MKRYTSRWLRGFFTERIIQDASSHSTSPLLISIFLGANDACLPPTSAHVPLPEFETHIRHYVDTILTDPATKGTRVLLITPPPINVPAPKEETWESEIPAVKETLKRDSERGIENNRGYMTWCSKRDYARRIVELGMEYGEQTGLVGALDFWAKITDFGTGEAENRGWKRPEGDKEQKIEVGCGLPGAPEFGRDVFVDGLHLGEKGYGVLSQEVINFITKKWPELKRENLSLVKE